MLVVERRLPSSRTAIDEVLLSIEFLFLVLLSVVPPGKIAGVILGEWAGEDRCFLSYRPLLLGVYQLAASDLAAGLLDAGIHRRVVVICQSHVVGVRWVPVLNIFLELE